MLAAIDPEAPIFLHSMWRTGSSYLLSRFEANDRYLTFYEPWNGEIGSRTLRRRASNDPTAKRAALHHPGSDRSYFQIYDEADPATGKPLWRLATPRLPIHDVYNGLSRDGERLLDTCIRLARARGRTPVFGFCHSGLQVAAMRELYGGEHVYLSRPSIDQFQSYRPGTNDFFMPATVMQLLASRPLRAAALELVPALRRYANPLTTLRARRAPHRLTMRLARRITARLDQPSLFLLFQLAWRAANDHGRRHSARTVSLKTLQEPDERRWMEQRFAISLDELRYPERPLPDLAPRIPELQARVDRVIDPVGA